MANKVLNLSLMHSVFGEDPTFPVKIQVFANKTVATKDDTVLTTKERDQTLFPDVGNYTVCVKGTDGVDSVVTLVEKKSFLKQSPLFQSY